MVSDRALESGALSRQNICRFIEKYSTEPNSAHQKCRLCRAAQPVHSLHFPETSWTWFELTDRPVLPSLEISYYPLATQQTHTLQAIIYLGGGHFTARMRKGPDLWWKYDDQWKFGKPQPETITTSEELRWLGNRRPAFLIYRRCNVDG